MTRKVINLGPEDATRDGLFQAMKRFYFSFEVEPTDMYIPTDIEPLLNKFCKYECDCWTKRDKSNEYLANMLVHYEADSFRLEAD